MADIANDGVVDVPIPESTHQSNGQAEYERIPDGLLKDIYPDTQFAWSLDLIEMSRKFDELATASVGKPPYWWVDQYGIWLKEKLHLDYEFRPGYVMNVIHRVRTRTISEKKERDEQLKSMLNSPIFTEDSA